MIKDIVVNLGLGAHDPAGEFAISLAETSGPCAGRRLRPTSR